MTGITKARLDVEHALAGLRAGEPEGLRALLQTADLDGVLETLEAVLETRPVETVVAALQEVERVVSEVPSSSHGPVGNWAVRLLEAPNSSVRWAAAQLLGATGTPEAERPLARLVRHDPAAEVRIAAAEALGGIASRGGPGALALREVIAAGCPPRLYARALLSLALIPDTEAAPAAMCALGHGAPDVRRAAAQAIFDLRPAIGSRGLPAETYGALCQALVHESDARVRERLVAALDRVVRTPERRELPRLGERSGLAALTAVMPLPEMTR